METTFFGLVYGLMIFATVLFFFVFMQGVRGKISPFQTYFRLIACLNVLFLGFVPYAIVSILPNLSFG